MKKISFTFKNKISTNKTSLLIKGLYKKQKLNTFLNTSDNKNIKNILKIEKFEAKFNNAINVYGLENIQRIIIVGLGEKSTFTTDKLRSIAAKLIKRCNNKNL